LPDVGITTTTYRKLKLHIRFHDLQHTAATLLLQQGVHPKVVSELPGHSSIGLTLDIYSHVIPDMQQQAVAAIHTLLRG
jgi:integrase